MAEIKGHLNVQGDLSAYNLGDAAFKDTGEDVDEVAAGDHTHPELLTDAEKANCFLFNWAVFR